MSNYCKECYKKQEQIEQLKAENERLKEEMCSNCDFQKQYFVETKNLLDENKKLRNKICKERAETREDFEKIKQALQEIRDIAKEQLQDVSDRCINTTPMYIVHKYISDKINEVIGAE